MACDDSVITLLMEKDESLSTPEDRINLTAKGAKELKVMCRDAGATKKEIDAAAGS